jgi:3-phenylpropionate/cinnamic acid dioxygenase small subunit
VSEPPADAPAVSDALLREVEQFLYAEAALLDHWQVEAWLALFTADCRYWVPTISEAEGEDEDPADDLSLIYDDHDMLEDRVLRLHSAAVHSQNPRTRTRRLIGNVRVEPLTDGELRVRSYFTLHAARLDREHVLGGEYEHLLRREDGRWRIRQKKVLLVNSAVQLTNVTVLL